MRRVAALVLTLLLPLVAAVSPTRAALKDDLAEEDMSVMVGPSPWGWNLVGVKKDLYREPQTTLFATAGLGMLFVGVGAAWHPQGRDADGPIVSGALGVLGAEVGASYQWMLNPKDSIHFGLHFGSGWVWDEHLLPIVAWERRL